MARFDLYAHVHGGFLLDVQSDLLDELNTRMIVPVLPQHLAPLPARRLNPVFELAATPHVMVTQFMAAVPVAALGPPVDTLAPQADEVTAAIDMLMQGF
ncbi:CcdB family protein [Sulfitobacter sp. S190]|uniref:CcdB family protein n=1 Tax=Sulfitobacter sp. S190 TaxID=2867022 RepID=UPI0021A48ADF|nr:CcdB family protein [Sulfitobacter sp. S190]UWR24333.1 CcdB family protein [Sulfitobacter sp. S190]